MTGHLFSFSFLICENGTTLLCSIILETMKAKHLAQYLTSSPCLRNGATVILILVESFVTGILEQPCSFLSQRPHTCCSLCLEHFSFLLSLEVSFSCSSTVPSQRPLSFLSNFKSTHSDHLLLEDLSFSFLVPLRVVLRSIILYACLMSVCPSGLHAPGELEDLNRQGP